KSLVNTNTINSKIRGDFTALMLAAHPHFYSDESAKIVKFLLKNNADPTIKNERNKIALDMAKVSNHGDIIKLLNDATIAKLIKEQGGIDPISMEDISQTPLNELMILGEERPRVFLKKTIMNHMLSKVGSQEGILDPFTRNPIPDDVQKNLLEYFGLPLDLLRVDGALYRGAIEIQWMENMIVMMGEPETEEERKELKRIKDRLAIFKKRFNDILAQENYIYGE
ncbi:MAG: hypothetical protein WCD44_03525, partial [Candidatus Babeliales bacterium]